MTKTVSHVQNVKTHTHTHTQTSPGMQMTCCRRWLAILDQNAGRSKKQFSYFYNHIYCFFKHVICIPVVVVKVDTTTADWTIRWWRARRRRCIHHPWRWLRRLLLLLCWWPRHTQRNKICSSRYNVDWWRWCFFWKHMYDCTLGTMKIRLKATLNRCVNSHHCMLIDECMHLSLKGHSEINLTVQQIYARWTKDFSCVHDLTCRSHCYMFVPLTVVIWPLTFAFAGPTAWNSLPDIIRSAESINTFKRLLKSFLFSVSYPGLSFSVTACYTYSLY